MQAGREIKFRAWVSKFGRTWMETCIGVNPFHVTDGDRFIWKHEEVALMQFTGIRDKNGKEIYEGDILLDGLGNHRPVEWADNFGAYRVRHHGEYLHSIASESEVIGNVYEHRELLEKL